MLVEFFFFGYISVSKYSSFPEYLVLASSPFFVFYVSAVQFLLLLWTPKMPSRTMSGERTGRRRSHLSALAQALCTSRVFILKGISLEIDTSSNIHELPLSPVLTLVSDHLNQRL